MRRHLCELTLFAVASATILGCGGKGRAQAVEAEIDWPDAAAMKPAPADETVAASDAGMRVASDAGPQR